MLVWFLVKDPMELEVLASEPGPRRTGWRDYIRVRAVNDSGQIDTSLLRRANHVALVQMAARDLVSEDPMALVDDITSELSHLADAILGCALECARTEIPRSSSVRIIVVTIRKAGAEELNYVSDVDAIHIAEPAEGVDHEEAIRAGTRVVTAIARICSTHTSEGTVWPADAALRPKDNVGPLVRGLISCTTYCGRWTRNWEFQAPLRARPMAGDRELGQAFCGMVSPLVWEVAQHPRFPLGVHAVRNRIISLIPAKETNREIKFSVGGLRNTEFTVQPLQLVHGREGEQVRARGTFEALYTLVVFGYIGRDDGADMTRAYRVQRVPEHRVQLRRLHRTHLMSDDGPGQIHLARTTGRAPDEVRDMWRGSTHAVGKLQQRIFFSPLLDAVSAIPMAELRLSTDAAQERLRVLGFGDARAALGHIQALTSDSTRAVEIQWQLVPIMLGWFAEGPSPDYDLPIFRQLSEALGTNSWYLWALRDEG